MSRGSIPTSRRCEGVALLVVLSLMVILVGLVVTIMVIVAGERRATASMNESVRVVQLASSAPEMVISQV